MNDNWIRSAQVKINFCYPAAHLGPHMEAPPADIIETTMQNLDDEMSLFQSWIAQEIFALSLVSLEFWWSLTTWDICRWVQNQRGNLRQLSFLTTAAKNATKNSPDLTDKSLKNAFFYVVGTLYQKGQPSFYSLFEKANKAIIYQKHSFPVYYLLRNERHRLVILFDHIGLFWNRTQFRSLIPNLTCLQIVFELHSLECVHAFIKK